MCVLFFIFEHSHTATIMKTLITIIFILILSLATIAQNTYYVSTTGNNSNNGTSTTTAWRTISFAASALSPVQPGDTVYIKAGNYGNENVIFETDGTANNIITFEGYKITPGDNPNLNWQYGDNLNASIMPLLDGIDRTTGTGITLHNRSFIQLKNIQIKNYRVGLYAYSGTNIKIKNVITMFFGDQTANYDGKGIVFGSHANNNEIDACVVYNACAEGLSITGNDNHATNCRVYCDDNSNGHQAAMDYYIHIAGNNNLVENCYVERIGDLDHGGHGIDLKTNCENNLIRNCISKGMDFSAFELRHRGVINNTLESCTAIGGGFSIRDGANHNIIKNCTTNNSRTAVSFFDTAEDGGAQYAGAFNIFQNCIFKNTINEVIAFHRYDRPSPADNNTFVNCVVDGGDYLFTVDRENNNNKMVNCIVTNVAHFSRTAYHQSISYSLHVSFNYTNFWSNGFTTPTGTNLITTNPLFVDLANNDYHLTSNSPCIDAGTLTNSPSFDFENNPRPAGTGVDIGAFEYNPSLHVEQILIYPNPTTTNNIVLKGAAFNLKQIKIYDTLGKEYSKLTTKQVISPTIVTIDITNLASGIYFIKTKTTSRILYKK